MEATTNRTLNPSNHHTSQITLRGTTTVPLKIIQWNVCSVRSKKHHLILLINKHQPDIVLLNETWLQSEQGFHIKGFVTIRSDRHDGYGGVATLVSNKIPFYRIMINTNSHPNNFQFIAIKVSNLTLVNTYCPPNVALLPKVWQKFIQSFHAPILLMGDLNAHHHGWDTAPVNRNGRTISDSLDSLELVILNDGSATRFTPPSSIHISAVDLALCSSNLALDTAWTVENDPGVSDHYPVICELNPQAIQHTSSKFNPRRLYKKANWSLFSETVSELDMQTPPTNYDDVHTHIIQAADAAIPCSKPPSKNHRVPVPWWDDECDKAMSTRKRTLAEFRHSCTMDNYLKVKNAIAATHRLFKIKKKEKFRVFCGTLNRESSPRKVWKFYQSMSRSLNPQLRVSFPPTLIAIDILEHLSVCNIMPDFRIKSYVKEYEPFSQAELGYVISRKKDTAVGLDQISNSMIKHLPNKSLNLILDFYNQCLLGCPIPKSWKTLLTYPFLKPGKDPLKHNSYRPISLGSCVGKNFESLIKNRLEWIIENRQLLSPLQTAFRKGRSVLDNIAYLTTYVQVGFSKNLYSLAVFLDVASAFDNVNIYTLYNILIDLNIPTNLCNAIFNLFDNRQIYVKDMSGNMHGPKYATQGLSQGSPLSPTLFNLYMHGLSNLVDPAYAKIMIYADDVVILSQGKDIEAVTDKINATLTKISDWLTDHNLSISSSKSSALLFQKRGSRDNLRPIALNNEIIPWKKSVKYLGVIIQNNLSWADHATYICGKAQKGLNLMRASSGKWWGADPQTLRTVYYGLVRSHLDYCCQILSPITKQLSIQLDRVQFQGLRSILGCMKSTPTNVLQAEASEPSLDHRRKWLSVKYLLKIVILKNHPILELIEELQHFTLNNIGYWRNKSCPHLVEAYRFISEHCRHISRFDIYPCFQVELSHQVAKIPYVELELKKLRDNRVPFYHILDKRWPHNVAIYTDASRDPTNNISAIGVYVPVTNTEYSQVLPAYTQIYTAEIVAIQKACNYIQNAGLRNVVIFSDSKTALQLITNACYSDKSLYIALKTKQKILDLKKSGVSIELVWVPSHTNIPGNDKADALAKAGTLLNNAHRSKIDAQNFIPTIKERLWLQWQSEWTQTTIIKGQWYAGFQDRFPKTPWFRNFPFLNRKHSSTLIRIRTGHCLTNKHKFRIGVADSPYCECGAIEDLNHIFFECPINIIPHYDIYQKLVTCKMPTPIDIRTVLQHNNFEASIVLTTFLKKNEIFL